MLLFALMTALQASVPCNEFRGNLTGTKWAQAPYNNVGPYFEAARLCDRDRGAENTQR